MIIDTDVLIWYLRGNDSAFEIVEQNIPFSLSVITYMELLQGMRNKEESRIFEKQLKKWQTDIIQIDAQISIRGMFYVQEYALSHAMKLADALVAATAVRNGEKLLTANSRHYRFIPNLDLVEFLPA